MLMKPNFYLGVVKNIKKRLPAFPDDQLIRQDFFEHQGQYDLIIEQTFFCAINTALRKKYVEHMHNLLKPTGKLIGLLFNDVLNSDKPPFGGNMQEYETLFSKIFNIKVLEPCYNSIKPRVGRELFMILEKKA
jgi:SAM-dependent methyltransferase